MCERACAYVHACVRACVVYYICVQPTPARIPRATANPMGIVGMNRLSFRLSFVEPYIVRTKMAVIHASTNNPCQGSISGLTNVAESSSR